MIKNKIGFVGLGNVGEKLVKNLSKSKNKIFLFDINKKTYQKFNKSDFNFCKNLKELTLKCNIIITCLPSPLAVDKVLNKIIPHINKSHLWIEMSTTDYKQMIFFSKLVERKKGNVIEAPITGGEHRAKSGNISILVSGKKKYFKKSFSILSLMGHNILYCGKIGNASILKVLTNYLASLHLLGIGEALSLAKHHKIDLSLAQKAIKISSGNSFVNETETKVILSGSYDVGFTMDLVNKDLSLFKKLLKKEKTITQLFSIVQKTFNIGLKKYGKRSFSTSIVKLYEENNKINLRSKKFPKKLIDISPKQKAVEVI